MAVSKAEKTSFVTEVYQQIHHLIMSGAWKEGDKLPTEHQLAERFHVSRVVVREALQALRAENLIVTKHGTGSFVSNPQNFLPHHFDTDSGIRLSEEEFQDMIDVRTYIEFRAIDLAAKWATEEDLDAIRQALERMQEHCGDLDAFTQADYDFHRAVVLASHNRMLRHIMEACQDQFFYCLREMNKLRENGINSLAMHQELYALLTVRDASSAVKCLKRHNEYNYARLSAFFQSDS